MDEIVPKIIELSIKYREIKNQGVVYSVEIGESRSVFVDFFRDNIGWCREGA